MVRMSFLAVYDKDLTNPILHMSSIMQQIQNGIFTVDIDPQQGYFSIRPQDEKFPALQNIRLGVRTVIKIL
jgi:hypothetical protein